MRARRLGSGQGPGVPPVAPAPKRDRLGRGVEFTLRLLSRCLRLLPVSSLQWLGRRLGDLVFLSLPGRRRIARENLALAFGHELNAEQLDALCRQTFEQLGMTFVEVLGFLIPAPTFPLARIRVEGLEHLRAAMERGKGVLLLTAHFGNWELLAAAHVLSGYSLSVVARPMDSPPLDRLVTRFRRQSGFEIIAKRRSLPEVIDALRRHRMVAILLDQNVTRREGVFVPFFGRLASTSKGLALLALRTDAPVVPIFIRREAPGHHRIMIEPEIPPPRTGDREKDVLAFTAAFTRSVEEVVRRWPAQWFWVHRRWKTRPEEER